MSNPLLIKNYDSATGIAKNRIVTVDYGATAPEVAQSEDQDGELLGVSLLDSVEGDRVDIVIQGIADVEYGSSVTIGQLLTADADGKAIPVIPSALDDRRIIGLALAPGVAGDIGSMLISHSIILQTT